MDRIGKLEIEKKELVKLADSFINAVDSKRPDVIAIQRNKLVAYLNIISPNEKKQNET